MLTENGQADSERTNLQEVLLRGALVQSPIVAFQHVHVVEQRVVQQRHDQVRVASSILPEKVSIAKRIRVSIAKKSIANSKHKKLINNPPRDFWRLSFNIQLEGNIFSWNKFFWYPYIRGPSTKIIPQMDISLGNEP